MKLNENILKNLNESDIIKFDKDIVDKVYSEYEEEKPEIINGIKKEYNKFTNTLLKSGISKEDIDKLPEIKAYKDAINNPEDIWCECNKIEETRYKPDNTPYLGVYKHGYLCNKCKKYTQIG